MESQSQDPQIAASLARIEAQGEAHAEGQKHLRELIEAQGKAHTAALKAQGEAHAAALKAQGEALAEGQQRLREGLQDVKQDLKGDTQEVKQNLKDHREREDVILAELTAGLAELKADMGKLQAVGETHLFWIKVIFIPIAIGIVMLAVKALFLGGLA